MMGLSSGGYGNRGREENTTCKDTDGKTSLRTGVHCLMGRVKLCSKVGHMIDVSRITFCSPLTRFHQL